MVGSYGVSQAESVRRGFLWGLCLMICSEESVKHSFSLVLSENSGNCMNIYIYIYLI